MADAKISALDNLTSADPANDMIPIVDVSATPPASGNTKRISINNLLACSPSATLASATITGALTVDTTTLVVNPSGYADRVGIGTETPGYDLEIAGAVRSSLAIRGNFAGGTDIAHLRFVNANGSVVGDIFSQNTNGGASDSAYLSFNTTSSGTSAERYRIASDGVATWSVAGTTAMTLNSTGLGVGVVPANNKFQVAGNIGLPNSCTASGETSGVFSIDVANLLTLTGANWRQTSILIVYSGIDTGASNPTVLQTVVTLTGLATWNTISKNDIVGTASVAVSNDTTTGARITVTVPTGNSGSVYAMLLGGAGGTTRPSMTINA